MSQDFNLITKHRDYDLSNNIEFDEMLKLKEYEDVFVSEDMDYIEITFAIAEKMILDTKLSEHTRKIIKRSMEISKEKGLEYIAFEYF